MNERIERNLAKQEAYFEGLDDGIQEGMEKNQKQIIMNMYNQNYKIEDIVSITNLTSLQVEKIIQEEKKN